MHMRRHRIGGDVRLVAADSNTVQRVSYLQRMAKAAHHKRQIVERGGIDALVKACRRGMVGPVGPYALHGTAHALHACTEAYRGVHALAHALTRMHTSPSALKSMPAGATARASGRLRRVRSQIVRQGRDRAAAPHASARRRCLVRDPRARSVGRWVGVGARGRRCVLHTWRGCSTAAAVCTARVGNSATSGAVYRIGMR